MTQAPDVRESCKQLIFSLHGCQGDFSPQVFQWRTAACCSWMILLTLPSLIFFKFICEILMWHSQTVWPSFGTAGFWGGYLFQMAVIVAIYHSTCTGKYTACFCSCSVHIKAVCMQSAAWWLLNACRVNADIFMCEKSHCTKRYSQSNVFTLILLTCAVGWSLIDWLLIDLCSRATADCSWVVTDW
jgi:hypothetical protein